MNYANTDSNQSTFRNELMLQIVLHVVVFLLFAYNRREQTIQFDFIVYFIPYAIAGLIINYKLLPSLFYKKKYWQFVIGFLGIVFFLVGFEELVVEKVFYPDSRGKNFTGFLFGFVEILPTIIILTAFKFAWDALMKQNKVEALERAVRESELQFLKSQINPHFLFNNLNNLYSYALENSPKTPKIILELSSVLRYMLYECKEEYVPLQKEIKQLEDFTKLNELQIEERGQVNFVKKNIAGQYQIAPLILMVFIENAFKHSQSSLSSDIKIDISVSLEDDNSLRFNCKNNYQKQTNIDQLTRGIGLSNVRKRLDFLYPDSYKLDIKESADQYEVDLVIKLHQAQATTVEVKENYIGVPQIGKV